jgi:transposase
MWTAIARLVYKPKAKRYESDLTDEQWARLEPFLPERSIRGRPPKWSIRQILNAIFYMLRAGCQWRYLPKDFPPFTTVQHYFYTWRDNGFILQLNHLLVMDAREAMGREASPTAGIIDSQSTKTIEHAEHIGYDSGKKVKGRKRHMITDTNGFIMGAVVHPANIQDRDGACLVLESTRYLYPWMRYVFADGAYAGPKLKSKLKKLGKWIFKIIKRSDRIKGFELLPRRWVVERTFSWLLRNRRLAKDVERSIESARIWIFLASVQITLKKITTYRIVN